MNHRGIKMLRAFSLVEMLVVIVIIGILLAFMLPVFAKAIDKARKVGRPVDAADPSRGILGPSSVRPEDLD
ncbi:MAG: type II secretion system protein [Verrucomicrobia subdivision 3 bacterium]|nr:type II secretion system protein [Limisphaerales bacterium]